MQGLLPPFDFHNVFVEPWADAGSGFIWVALMGLLVNIACGLVGNFLVLRRMALVGDAISHSVLPGLALMFLLAGSRSTAPMFVGALLAALVTTLMIETIYKKSRVKQDAAISIAFSTLFAVGVVLISLFADVVDLDQGCVLYGEISFVPLEPFVQIAGYPVAPPSVLRMAAMALVTALATLLFYKELLVSSFDELFAANLGIRPKVVHYALMTLLALVVVSAFESVGAILVVAMLIFPGVTAGLLSQRLPVMLGLTCLHALLSTVAGIHLALWLDSSVSACIVLAGGVLFALALAWHWRRRRLDRQHGRPEPLTTAA